VEAVFTIFKSICLIIKRAVRKRSLGDKLQMKRTVLAVTLSLLALSLGANAGSMGKKDIVDTAVAAGKFNTLAKALQAAGLVDTLKGPGPFTVFAPTDEAFAKLPAGTLDDLLKPENHEKLVAILTYHVVPGKIMAKQVMKLHEAKTVNGKELKFKTQDGTVMVDNATVIQPDIACSNGVIHVIDSVLLPQ
jgi:uncharacterized surface protein with fasciclin (FAS1) repeats